MPGKKNNGTGDRNAPVVPTDHTELVCLSYCRSFYHYDECRQICLAASGTNTSLYRRAMLQAEADGLPEEWQHLFAAGAVWGYVQYKKGKES